MSWKWIIVAGLVGTGAWHALASRPYAAADSGSTSSSVATMPAAQVWFSPNGGCTDAIVAVVGQARRSALVQAYSFTSAPIAKALKDAQDRGVDVRVILDKSQRTEKYSGLTYLQHAGIPVWIDAAHAISHNKVMVIDGEVVVTGSFNFTSSAESRNAENLLIFHDQTLAAAYTNNWADHLAHSEAP
jgi:phosphatidylserine/phosphatidylglycerophosphate/cardiolipin synthase-like enzyme